MTKARMAALEILRSADHPLTAGEIHAVANPPCDQATVYRTLHYLESRGFIDSFALRCSAHGTERYYTYYDGPNKHHRHWFHCECCHRFIDLGLCSIESLLYDYSKTHDFEIRSHTLTLMGVCQECLANENNGE